MQLRSVYFNWFFDCMFWAGKKWWQIVAESRLNCIRSVWMLIMNWHRSLSTVLCGFHEKHSLDMVISDFHHTSICQIIIDGTHAAIIIPSTSNGILTIDSLCTLRIDSVRFVCLRISNFNGFAAYLLINYWQTVTPIRLIRFGEMQFLLALRLVCGALLKTMPIIHC